jgi:regulator of RNase E activity RraA
MADRWATQLENCYTGAVYDVLRDMGRDNQVLPSSLRPLNPDEKLAGKVYTVSGRRDSSQSPHETLLAWTTLLSQSPPDSVVLCQPNDSTLAHMGELSAETLKSRGVRGYIVDGGCRDTQFIQSIGFPVFCCYFTPVDIVGRWVADQFQEPIVIGSVVIHPDDYVLADSDGIVILPGSIAFEVIERTELIMQTENRVRTAIQSGIDPRKAYLTYGKF